MNAHNVIVSTRMLDYPKEKVFNAFSQGEHLAQWWGPVGFKNAFHKFEFKPGGAWKFEMLGPNGARFDNESKFIEIKNNEKIVFEHLGPMHWFRMTITFEAHGNKAKLTWHMEFASEEECQKTKQFVVQGNEENFDKLNAYLAIQYDREQ